MTLSYMMRLATEQLGQSVVVVRRRYLWIQPGIAGSEIDSKECPNDPEEYSLSYKHPKENSAHQSRVQPQATHPVMSQAGIPKAFLYSPANFDNMSNSCLILPKTILIRSAGSLQAWVKELCPNAFSSQR